MGHELYRDTDLPELQNRIFAYALTAPGRRADVLAASGRGRVAEGANRL